MKNLFLLCCLLFWGTSLTFAKVELSQIFSDNMVLQRGIELPVWGRAAPGEIVSVKIGTQQEKATADKAGEWKIILSPMLASDQPKTMTVAGTNTIELKNVLVGDVWLCGGQSNMSWPLQDTEQGEVMIKNAPGHSRIRFFEAPQVHSATAQNRFPEEVNAEWQMPNAENAPKLSAIAYRYAHALQKRNDVPQGIILVAVGGSNAKLWIDRETQRAEIDLARDVEAYEQKMTKWNKDAAVRQFKSRVKSWEKRALAAEKAGRAVPPRPPEPMHPKDSYQRHGSYFNGMISPLIPFGLRGILFYHGEANARKPDEYKILFQTLIKDWRKRWQQPELPFLYVQLHNYRKLQFKPVQNRDKWPFVREVQASALQLPNTAMVVATDLGGAGEVHPRNKRSVATRLVQAARRVVFKEKVVVSGPSYHYYKIDRDAFIIHFKNVGQGLRLKRGERLLKGFAISGADGKWKWAEAYIDGDTVVVSSPDIPIPAAVRYNWADNPVGNLYNKENLPAAPFRTDDWSRNKR